MYLTSRPQSEWENVLDENPPHRFVLDCSSHPAGRDSFADTNGNSGSKASSSEIRLSAFSKRKSHPVIPPAVDLI